MLLSRSSSVKPSMSFEFLNICCLKERNCDKEFTIDDDDEMKDDRSIYRCRDGQHPDALKIRNCYNVTRFTTFFKADNFFDRFGGVVNSLFFHVHHFFYIYLPCVCRGPEDFWSTESESVIF